MTVRALRVHVALNVRDLAKSIEFYRKLFDLEPAKVRTGLITRDEMQTDCCFATQDKAWVLDPDGNEWEIFVVLKDNLPEKVEASTSCCSPVCCDDHTNTKIAADCACVTA